MFDENAYMPSDINIKNLEKLSSEQSDLQMRRVCEISEISYTASKVALELHSEGMGLYEILSVLSESFVFDKIEDRISFSRLLPDRLKRNGISAIETDFFRQTERKQVFVFVKNLLSDEAYDVFSQEFSSPRLRYVQGIRDAVKAVNDGEAGYCILPLEERGGVRLSSVAELIFGNELKINEVTPVFGQDGAADMKYALVSKCFTIPKITDDDDRYLEICLSCSDSLALDELLFVASAYKIVPYKVNTVFFYTDEGTKPHYSIVLRDDGDELIPLLTYLTLYSDEFVPIGIYKNLE